tara:strand:- start:41932 stop:42903 length:972 start_codon:yes stop_codon:yes gene_type:complete
LPNFGKHHAKIAKTIMLTSFFSTSKPIHHVLMVGVAILLFIFKMLVVPHPGASQLGFLYPMLSFLVFLFSMAVLNFIVKRNGLTKQGTYVPLAFVFLCLALPNVFLSGRIILAMLFVLLAFRRIISIRSQREIKKKIFDASLWLGVASLFYFWAILFIVPLFIAITTYAFKDYKNWMIPLTALACLALFALVYGLYLDDLRSFLEGYVEWPSYNFTAYSSPGLILPFSIILTLFIWCASRYLILMGKAQRKMKPLYFMILITAVIALFIAAVLSPIRNGAELYLLIPFLAILISRYIEKSKSQWFKEMMLWLIILLPIASLFL